MSLLHNEKIVQWKIYINGCTITYLKWPSSGPIHKLLSYFQIYYCLLAAYQLRQKAPTLETTDKLIFLR